MTACSDSIGPHITRLLQTCLRLGCHSICIKLAEKVFSKEKRDMFEAEGWVNISLLSSLGKGLERANAKRMSYLAIT